jgi:hypothetical protein
MAAAGEIAPEEIRFHEDRNRLLRCLGKDGDLKPAILAAPVTLGRGDAFLLASDGFWEYVNEVEMEADFAKSREPGEWLHRLEGRLLPRGREGQDNYTAVAVLYLGGNALPAAPATTPLPTTRRDPAATSSAHLPLAIAALTVLTIAVLGLAVARLKPEWLALRRDARLPVANYQQASAVPAGVVYRPDTRTTYPTLSQALREAAAEGGRLWLGPGVYRDLPRTLPAGLQLAGADERSTTLELTEHPLELTGGAGALAHLRIQAGPKLETALRIAGDFHGTVERVSLEGGGKSALLVVVEGGAHPKLVDNVFIPAPGGRCASGIELPAGNTCRSDETSFTPQPRPKRKPKSPPPLE